MNEGDSIDFFTESEQIIDAEEVPKFEGVCSKCLGSHFAITERNGVLGVVYTSTKNDSEGKAIKTLIHCECSVEVNY